MQQTTFVLCLTLLWVMGIESNAVDDGTSRSESEQTFHLHNAEVTTPQREFFTNQTSLDLIADDSPTNSKHEDFLRCEKWVLDPGEYLIFENGSVLVEAYNNTMYNTSFYVLEDHRLFVCSPIQPNDHFVESAEVSKYPLGLTYVTQVGMIISIVCLFLHLIVFCSVPQLRNLPGYNMASLCLSLFLGYLFFLVGFVDRVRDCFAPCAVIASATHFFLLASFLWMNTMAFDVFTTLLRATGKLRLATTKFTCKRFSFFCLYSWGVPFVFAAAAVAADNAVDFPEELRPQFGQDICWFRQKKPLLIFFAAPVFILIAVNMTFFAASAVTIFRHSMSPGDDVDRSTLKRNLTIYLRLAVIMGATWTVGILSSTLNSVALSYAFVVLNTLQGLFIFLAFTCTPKVHRHFLQKFDFHRRGHFTKATFHSYCNCGMSVQSTDRIETITREFSPHA